MRFSKSRYVAGLRCPKILWMNRRMPEQFDSSVRRERLIGEGAAVRELARGYYGECSEVPFDPSCKCQALFLLWGLDTSSSTRSRTSTDRKS